MNYIKKAMQLLKGGDEGKIKRFHKRLTMGLTDQIETRKRELAEKEENILDLDETFEIELYTIDIDKLKDTESIKASAANHVEKLLKLRRGVRKVREDIDRIRKEIEDLQRIVNEVTDNDS